MCVVFSGKAILDGFLALKAHDVQHFLGANNSVGVEHLSALVVIHDLVGVLFVSFYLDVKIVEGILAVPWREILGFDAVFPRDVNNPCFVIKLRKTGYHHLHHLHVFVVYPAYNVACSLDGGTLQGEDGTGGGDVVIFSTGKIGLTRIALEHIDLKRKMLPCHGGDGCRLEPTDAPFADVGALQHVLVPIGKLFLWNVAAIIL